MPKGVVVFSGLFGLIAALLAHETSELVAFPLLIGVPIALIIWCIWLTTRPTVPDRALSEEMYCKYLRDKEFNAALRSMSLAIGIVGISLIPTEGSWPQPAATLAASLVLTIPLALSVYDMDRRPEDMLCWADVDTYAFMLALPLAGIGVLRILVMVGWPSWIGFVTILAGTAVGACHSPKTFPRITEVRIGNQLFC